MKVLRLISRGFNTIRLIPHIILLNIHNTKEVIQYDIRRWVGILNFKKYESINLNFIYLMIMFPEYRNLFYYRIGPGYSQLIAWMYPKMNTLFIRTKEIGPGLFIQHGFATTIGANSIGKDCWINQQVTIGYSNTTDRPIIGNNVTINAGAKVIGKVIIGDNCKVGANAVVVKNVPNDCTVVGVPAYIVRRNGIKTKENL